MNRKLTFSIVIALVTLALVVAACGGNATPAPAAQPSATSAPVTQPTAPSAPAAQATTAPASQPIAAPIITATPAPQTFEIKYTYDGAGRLMQAEYSNGVIVKYAYDKAGNLVSRQATQK